MSKNRINSASENLQDGIIENMIYFIRGYKVMLDSDLALLYGVETKMLKRAVKRNLIRFPDDFMFELSKEEYDSLRCQIGTLKRGRHSKYLPCLLLISSSIILGL